MTPRIGFASAAAILLAAGTMTSAKPVPTPPLIPKPAGPMPVPYPDPPPPPVPECPYSLCPKAAGTLQFAGGASTIEVESFSWGAGGPTTVNTSDPQEGGQIARTKPKISEIPIVKLKDKSSSNLATSDPQEGGEVAGRKAGGTQQDYPIISRGEGVKSVIPFENSVSSPRDVASGQASGKRQHKPLTMTRGSLDVTMPDGVCVAGAHYPAVTLRSGDTAYEMSDVTVASCTPVATAKGKKDKAKLDYMIVKMETVLISG